MPLSPPADRDLLHRREIRLHGYRRADGLFDIEAELGDTKSYGFALSDGRWLEPGTRLHGMTMRMTVDAGLRIIAFEAAMDDTPFAACGGAAANYARLAGLQIGRGFLKEAAARIGVTESCTHLRELLQQMATVAFQTTYSARPRREGGSDEAPPVLLNTCHGWSEANWRARESLRPPVAGRVPGRQADAAAG